MSRCAQRRRGGRVGRWPLALLSVVVALAAAAKGHEILVGQRDAELGYLGVELLDRPAPRVALFDRHGGRVRLEDLRGRWVFLNFWATWCDSCRLEMPSMDALARALQGEDFVMIAASVDEGWAPIDAFFGDAATGFRVFRDEEARAAAAFGTSKFPETFLLGPDGRLRARFVGPRDWSDPAFGLFFEELLGRPVSRGQALHAK